MDEDDESVRLLKLGFRDYLLDEFQNEDFFMRRITFIIDIVPKINLDSLCHRVCMIVSVSVCI